MGSAVKHHGRHNAKKRLPTSWRQKDLVYYWKTSLKVKKYIDAVCI